MKKYGYDTDATHSAAIYEKGTEAHIHADAGSTCTGHTEGVVVGTSEWVWMSEDTGRRICAALSFFSGASTEEMEELVANNFEYRRN